MHLARRFHLSHLAVLAAPLLALAFAGCDNTTQTTSGRSYLERYPTPVGLAASADPRHDPEAPPLDRLVAEVAAIEPRLVFPARIGLARIEHGRLVSVPATEGATWLDLRATLGDTYGEFVPVDLVVAEMVYSAHAVDPRTTSTLADTIARIRLGAARQHLDAVLIYEVALASDVRNTGWSVIDWTLVGAYARTSKAHATAHASALLVDVRNGYPYGTARAAAEDTRSASTFGAENRLARQRQAVVETAVERLAPEVASMLHKLRDARLATPQTTATGAAAASPPAPLTTR
jgi:hypothetical protein